MRFCGHACFLMPGFWFLGLWSSGPSVTWLFSRGAKSKKTQNGRINSSRNGSPCPCMLDTRVLGWLAEGSLLNREFLFDGNSTVQLVRVRRISDCRVHILNGHLHHIPLPQGSGDTKEEGTEREKPEGLEGSHQHCLPDIPGMLQPGTLKNCAIRYTRSAQAQTCQHSGVENEGLHGPLLLEEPQTTNGYCWEQTVFYTGVAPGRLSVP